MSSLFSTQEYCLYRYEYPESLFHSFRSFLNPVFRKDELSVLDLGCGTGLVAESFLQFYCFPLALHFIDPDSKMLQQAKNRFASNAHARSFQCAAAEQIPFPNASFDLVLIGSAWHWMNQADSLREIERVLRSGGFVFIFEYQFPKASALPALNDWIRNQFNSIWKPSHQTPRGSLKELTECWRGSSWFSQCDSRVVVQNRFHSASELAGVITSQSRYQHFEKSLPDFQQSELRAQLIKKIDEFLKSDSAKFSYCYEGYLFKKYV